MSDMNYQRFCKRLLRHQDLTLHQIVFGAQGWIYLNNILWIHKDQPKIAYERLRFLHSQDVLSEIVDCVRNQNWDQSKRLAEALSPVTKSEEIFGLESEIEKSSKDRHCAYLLPDMTLLWLGDLFYLSSYGVIQVTLVEWEEEEQETIAFAQEVLEGQRMMFQMFPE